MIGLFDFECRQKQKQRKDAPEIGGEESEGVRMVWGGDHKDTQFVFLLLNTTNFLQLLVSWTKMLWCRDQLLCWWVDVLVEQVQHYNYKDLGIKCL